MKHFTEHIEQYLGKIDRGWTRTPEGASVPFQVVACENGYIKYVTAFITLGISQVDLISPVSSKVIRQELLMTVRSQKDLPGIPDILQQLSIEALERGTAYLRGDVIGPRGNLFEGSVFEAIYVTIPSYYPDPFSVFNESDKIQKIVAWLVPITLKESQFIQRFGWADSNLKRNAREFLEDFVGRLIAKTFTRSIIHTHGHLVNL